MFHNFNKVRKFLNEEFNFHYDQIQLETKLELEIASRELFELIENLDLLFKIIIDLDGIDQLMKNHRILTIQDLII